MRGGEGYTVRNRFLKGAPVRMDTALHWNMSLVGGFLGTYAMTLRDGIFPSAQTGNLMGIAEDISGGNVTELLARLGFLVVFTSGLVTCCLLQRKHSYDPRRLSLLLDAAGLILTGCLPAKMNAFVAIYPLAFAASFQWGVFSGTEGRVSASIFSTNNLKQCVFGLTEFLISKNPEAGRQAAYYGPTVLAFLAGACIGSASAARLGAPAAVLGLLMLSPAHLLLSALKRREARERQKAAMQGEPA